MSSHDADPQRAEAAALKKSLKARQSEERVREHAEAETRADAKIARLRELRLARAAEEVQAKVTPCPKDHPAKRT